MIQQSEGPVSTINVLPTSTSIQKSGKDLMSYDELISIFTFKLNQERMAIRSEKATLTAMGELNPISESYFDYLLSSIADQGDIRLSHAKLLEISARNISSVKREMPLLFGEGTKDWIGFMPVEDSTEYAKDEVAYVLYGSSYGPNKWPLAAFRVTPSGHELELGHLSSLEQDSIKLIQDIANVILFSGGVVNDSASEDHQKVEITNTKYEENDNGKGEGTSESKPAITGLASQIKSTAAIILEGLRHRNGYSDLALSDVVRLNPHDIVSRKYLPDEGNVTFKESDILAPLENGYFPVIIPNFNESNIYVAQIDLRGLGLETLSGEIYDKSGTLNFPKKSAMFTFPTFRPDGELSQAELARLKIVTERYVEKKYVPEEKLVSKIDIDGQEVKLYIDGLGERGMQAPILWTENGVPTAGMRFIMPNFDPYHGITKVINGSSLGWTELPFHEHIPDSYRRQAREGVYYNYTDEVGYSKNGPIDNCRIFAWTEVSQLARLKRGNVHKGDIWGDIYKLLINFGKYLSNSDQYKTLVNKGIKLGVAVSASPLIAKKLVSPTFRAVANTQGLEIAQIGPTKYARGSKETPLLIYPT